MGSFLNIEIKPGIGCRQKSFYLQSDQVNIERREKREVPPGQKQTKNNKQQQQKQEVGGHLEREGKTPKV